MLGVEPDGQVAEPLLERVLRPAAHEVHLGVRPRGEGAEQRQDLPIRARQLGRRGERHQSPVVIEEQQEGLGLRHPPDQRPLRRRAADGGTLPRGGGRHLGQGLQERGDPAVHVEGLDPGPERREPENGSFPETSS